MKNYRCFSIAAEVSAMDSQEKINYLREMNTERDRRNQMQYQYDMGLEEGIGKGIEQGFDKGVEKGIEIGIEQESMRMARKMKAEGIAIDLIIKCSNLTREQIEKL